MLLSFLKKNSVPNAPESAKAKPGRKITLTQKIKIVAVSVIFALVVSGAVAYYVHLNFVVEVKRVQMQKLTDQRAELAADNVRAWINNKQAELMQIVGRPALGEMLIKQAAKNFSVPFDQLQKNPEEAGDFLVVREAKLNPEGTPPIRYSELAMISAALKGETVRPEIARIDSQWRVNFVLAIPGDSGAMVKETEVPDISGCLFATFSIDGVDKILKRNFQQHAQFSLVQKVADANAIETLKIGEGGTGIKASFAIPDSWWRVEVEANPSLADETLVQESFIYSMLGAMSICLVLISYLVGRYIGGRMDASGMTVTKGITELVTTKKEVVDPVYQQKEKDILDVQIKDKDEALLGLEEESKKPRKKVPLAKVEKADQASIPEEIFRAYDIRGIAHKQLTKELAEKIGQAIGSEALDNNETTLIVARDARTHSPELAEFLIRGITKSGCNVLNIGTVPTPVLYFATETLSESRSGVMVTASHNGAEYNGFKVVINGTCRSEEDIKAIRSRILSKNLHEGEGSETYRDVVSNYIDTIFSDVALAGDINIVLDAGNGITGIVAPRLFEQLGCQVTPLFCDLDGTFPNHVPDPSIPENLNPLIEKVKALRADLGVAFDGDGDRIVVVTGSGKIIWPDRLLMLFAKDIVSRNPGSDVVFDVKSTRQLVQAITSYGGRPIMWKTGHSPMKSKMLETGALLGGEYSGHIFIKDRWYGFDDGLYAAARLLEIITLQSESLDQIMEEFPETFVTPEIRVDIDEARKFDVIKRVHNEGNFGDAKITNIDGVRAEYKYGWGLIRASNTSPHLTLRFEADDAETLDKLKSIFAKELRKIDPTLKFDWA